MFKYQNSTALVTGASSGIGEAIVRELAARGIRELVLVARSGDKLTALAAELAGHGTKCHVVVADLRDKDAPQRVLDETTGLGIHVDLLVNNAGVGIAGPFEQQNQCPPAELVAVNVAAVTQMSYLFLPAMLERGRGAILNVASNAAFAPVPFSAAYGASKAFVLSLSEALWVEYHPRGVRVCCVVPGVTATNLDGPGRGEVRPVLDRIGIGTPAEVARVALDALDRDAPSQQVGRANGVFNGFLRQIPRVASARAIGSFKRPDELRAQFRFPLGSIALSLATKTLVVTGLLALGALLSRAKKHT